MDLEVQKLLEKADGNFAIFDSVAKAHFVLSRYDSIACSISGGRIVAQLVAIHKTHKSIKKHFDEF